MFVLAEPQTSTSTTSALIERLKRENQRLRTKVCRLKTKALKEKEKTWTKSEAIDIVSQFISGPALDFVRSQIQLSDRNSKGKRYSDKDKIFALSLYHYSPKCYKMMRKIFSLPGLTTLKGIMRGIDIKPGFHQSILEALHCKVQSMSEKSKMCAVVYDEMAIKEKLSYQAATDCLEGLEDLGNHGKTKYIANHAGVFMVRGLVEKWKQPVGYFLTSGPMSANNLQSALLSCIDSMQSNGLLVKVLICDQGANNMSVLKSLGITVEKPAFEHKGNVIHVIMDPPHLLKNIRNNLKKNGFIVAGKSVSWTFIEQFYHIDVGFPIRLAPKLTLRHIELPPFSSMRVRLAAQVLSHSVSAGITTLCMTSDKLDADAIHTAHFLEKFNNLFDVFNSSNLYDANNYKCAITSKSDHIMFLKGTLNWLNEVKRAGNGRALLPCLEGWKLSINSLIQLWDQLHQEKGLEFMLTNRLNQDCLENFFSRIRGRGGHRDNPDSVQFRSEYRAVAVDSLFSTCSNNSNCEDDIDKFLLQFGTGVTTSHCSASRHCLLGTNSEPVFPLAHNAELLGIDREPPELCQVEQNIVVYLAGYLAKKAMKKYNCHSCETLWQNTDPSSAGYTHLKNKQYSHLIDGGLFMPSSLLVSFVSVLEITFRSEIPEIIHNGKIREKFITKVNKGDKLPEISCNECSEVQSYMVHLYFIIRIHHVLREQNRTFSEPGRKRNRKTMKLLHI